MHAYHRQVKFTGLWLANADHLMRAVPNPLWRNLYSLLDAHASLILLKSSGYVPRFTPDFYNKQLQSYVGDIQRVGNQLQSLEETKMLNGELQSLISVFGNQTSGQYLVQQIRQEQLVKDLETAIATMKDAVTHINTARDKSKVLADEMKKEGKAFVAMKLAMAAMYMASAAADFFGGQGGDIAKAEEIAAEAGRAAEALASAVQAILKFSKVMVVLKKAVTGIASITMKLCRMLSDFMKKNFDVKNPKFWELAAKATELNDALKSSAPDIAPPTGDNLNSSDLTDPEEIEELRSAAISLGPAYWGGYVVAGTEAISSYLGGSIGTDAAGTAQAYVQNLKAAGAAGTQYSSAALMEVRRFSASWKSSRKNGSRTRPEWTSRLGCRTLICRLVCCQFSPGGIHSGAGLVSAPFSFRRDIHPFIARSPTTVRN